MPLILAAVLSVALLAEGVGRNCGSGQPLGDVRESPSSRRAWVEIRPVFISLSLVESPSSRRAWVEIAQKVCRPFGQFVALLAEGVGRNMNSCRTASRVSPSPSSRRAWVEMTTLAGRLHSCHSVALLAEGVGRNTLYLSDADRNAMSPSSRRAWVEI